MSLTIIILAAGRSKRMASDIPKVMQKLAGFPMIEYLLETVHELGVDDIRLVVNAELKDYMLSHPLSVDCKYQTVVQKRPLGTASAVMSAIEISPLAEQVLVLYGDVPMVSVSTLRAMLQKLETSPEISMVSLGFDADIPNGYGRMVVVENYLVNIVEDRDATPSQQAIKLCHSGLMVLNREVLSVCLDKIKNDNAAQEYYLTDIIEIANRSGYACGYTVADELELMGINSQSQLSEANFIVQTKLRQNLMTQGVTMEDPNSTFLSRDTKIGRGTRLEPFIYIGPGVDISKNCLIRAYSHLEGVSVGDDCIIGPFARIRPSTELGSHVVIGNFVEVKNSIVGSGVKSKHLVYIGDAEIGASSNIGGGAIFCSFDGKKKNKTIVGERAFIGGNVSIVAPLTLGDGSFIAAGTVVTVDVPDEEMAISRVKQVNIPRKADKLADS